MAGIALTVNLAGCELQYTFTLDPISDTYYYSFDCAEISLDYVIVHGKEIKAKLLFQDDNYKIEYSGIYEKILDYFKEQKVLKSHQLRSSGHKILSIQSTNHFIKITDKFIDKIIIKILEEQGVSHGEIFSYRFNILGNHGIDYEEIYPKSQNIKMNDDDLPF